MNVRIISIVIAFGLLTPFGQDDLSGVALAQGTTSDKGSSKTGAAPLPPTITENLGISTESYSYDAFGEYASATMKINQIPSRCIAIGRGGNRVRIAYLSKIDLKREILVYKVEYPGYKLASLAEVKLGWYRSIMEETFEAKWLIRYEYTKPGIKPIPVSFSVFAYSPKTKQYDTLVRKWTVKEVLQGGRLRCQDDKGKIILRDLSDSEIGSGRM